MKFPTLITAALLVLASTGAAAQWTTCAKEDGVCGFDGRREVAYGAGNAWITKVFMNGVKCASDKFGRDPAPGVAKTCRIRDVNAVGSPAPGPWIACAKEDGFCKFGGRKEVAYGTGNQWTIKFFANGVKCNNDRFGDPAPGKAKSCQFRDSAVPVSSATIAPHWVRCANEGQTCKFSGSHKVAYGAEKRFNYRVLANGAPCSNLTFGDPAPGKAKACFYDPD
jgi:hypothetical protein